MFSVLRFKKSIQKRDIENGNENKNMSSWMIQIGLNFVALLIFAENGFNSWCYNLTFRAFLSTIFKNLAFTIAKLNFITYSISLFNTTYIKTFILIFTISFKYYFIIIFQ